MRSAPSLPIDLLVPIDVVIHDPSADAHDDSEVNAIDVDVSAFSRSPARWPVRLCALVAIAAATYSFLLSPVGQRPEVQRVVRELQSEASRGVTATRDALNARLR